ncbi:MAG: glutathione S-transferase family protein [Hyphomicrobiales bacterium]
MSLKLYHCHEFRSVRSLWLMHELGLDFELQIIPVGPALRNPDYLALHPLGRVPCLVDGDLTLFESGAICQYLCETYDDGTLGRPVGHPERSEWLQWLHFAETISVHGSTLTHQNVFLRDDAQRSPYLQKLDTRRLEKCFEVLDTVLTDRDHMLASGFSAADTMIGFSVYQGAFFTTLGNHANLEAYYQRISSRPAFEAAMPAPDDPLRVYRQDRYGEYGR